jgi:drug/metabolite transporter (DMT)-like permease
VRLNRWNLTVAGLAASWGFVSVIVAGVDLSGEVLVFWRCLIAAVVLPLLLLAMGRIGVLVLRGRGVQLIGLGLLLAVHWTLFFEALKRASVAVAILTVYTAPIFLAVLAPLLLPERRSRIGLVALAISAPGLVLIALAGEGGSGADPVAVLMGLGAALAYAFLVMATKTVVREVSPFAVAFWTYAVVAVVIVPFVLSNGRVVPHASEWPSVLALGALLTALSGVVYMRALRDVTAQAAGLLAYVEPVSATFLAWAILGQEFGWQVALGGAAVLAGGALVVLYEPEEAAVPDAVPAGVRMHA